MIPAVIGVARVNDHEALPCTKHGTQMLEGEALGRVLAGLQARDDLEGAWVVGEGGVRGLASGLDPCGSPRIRRAEGESVRRMAGSVRLVSRRE